MLKFLLIIKENQIESCQKCLLVKTCGWHKKNFMHWFNQKQAWNSALKIDGCMAAKRKIFFSWHDFRAPQGFILHPTLFLLYINDLPVVYNAAIYTDDTILYSSVSRHLICGNK